MHLTTQLSSLLSEIFTLTPDYFQAFLTDQQRQRITEIVDRILIDTTKKTKSVLFRWKAAVHATRFIKRTSSLLTNAHRYQQSIVSILCGLCSEDEMSHFVKTMQHDMVEDVDSTFNDSWNHQMNEPEPSQCKVIHSDVSPRASYSNIPCHSVSLPSPSTCQYLPCLDDTTMGGNSNDSKCNTSPNSPEKLMHINPNNLAFRTEGSDNVTNITKKLTTMDFHVPTSQHVNHSPQRLNSIPSKATKRIIPTDKDVLFGRGQGVNRHIGNIRFRKIVKAMKKDYKRLATKGKRKMGLSSSLVEHIRRYGGRFLIFDANTLDWVEADMKRKREKCSQALREKMNESSHVNT